MKIPPTPFRAPRKLGSHRTSLIQRGEKLLRGIQRKRPTSIVSEGGTPSGSDWGCRGTPIEDVTSPPPMVGPARWVGQTHVRVALSMVSNRSFRGGRGFWPASHRQMVEASTPGAIASCSWVRPWIVRYAGSCSGNVVDSSKGVVEELDKPRDEAGGRNGVVAFPVRDGADAHADRRAVDRRPPMQHPREPPSRFAGVSARALGSVLLAQTPIAKG